MPILSLDKVSLSYHGPPLLDAVDLLVDPGERIGLLGRNGEGKSTLLRLLDGSLAPDSGVVQRLAGLRVEALRQDVPAEIAGTVREHVLGGREPGGEQAWRLEGRVERLVADLSLDPGAPVATLSAGTKRRVLLARALAADPDLLLLDEPTNHLDLDTIAFLEDVLVRRSGALVFVTHDRGFLRRVATRILHLDRGALRSHRMDYAAYLEQREHELRIEAAQDAEFDRKLAQEETWLRQGIKARRTRNEGRVRTLETLRRERVARRDATGRVNAQIQDAERSGRIVLRAQDLSYDFGAAPIVRGFSGTVMRGDRIGILGPNGCGKTTLLRLLLGELAPRSGDVRMGVKVEVAHFEQLHDVLDEERSVADNVADGREVLAINGVDRHVVGYLRDFLFSPEQIRGPVRKLSGGERRRLQLARVLARPSNLLVLDEPTNDLDLETLELLEDLLLGYTGTLLVVSHDREFLDNVVTSTVVSEGDGVWREYVGGYTDWVRQRTPGSEVRPSRVAPARSRPEPAAPRPRRLGFKEQRELDGLPARIEALEAERRVLGELLSSPAFYASPGEEIARSRERLGQLGEAIRLAEDRWLELESLRSGDPID